jgi:Gram-negative bacterial TonB protein C-terminal
MRVATLVFIGALSVSALSKAQLAATDFPSRVLFARHTFFDFGPPFNYYEVLSLEGNGSSTKVNRILVTPAGQACIQPPTVENEGTSIGKPLDQFLLGRNPCDIPEKALRRERERCKHCLTFSGVNVTVSVRCGTADRLIRMDITDKDLFDASAKIPPNTSWTMEVLHQIDQSLGPGVMDKPAFSPGPPKIDSPHSSDPAMLEDLKDGKYDGLFPSNKKLSELYRESQEPTRLPSVQITGITPVAPLSAEAPPYPPIARAAHVEGEVDVSFDVSPAGTVHGLSFESGPEILRRVVTDRVLTWKFPESPEVHREHGKIVFRLNCPAHTP